MKEIKRYLRCTTESKRTGKVIELDDGEGNIRRCPLFQWKLCVYEVEKPTKSRRALEKIPFIEKIEYHLHPTFAQPVRVLDEGPFEVVEEGYGSFDIKVVVQFKNGELLSFTHGLLLEKPRNDSSHTVKFKNPTEEFLQLLTANFPIEPVQPPLGLSNLSAGVSTSASSSSAGLADRPSRKRLRTAADRLSTSKPLHQSQQQSLSLSNGGSGADDEKQSGNGGILYGFSVDELTDRLYSLQGQAIFKAVELVKKYRTQSSFIEDNGSEFHFDLYTLSPDAIHALWDLACASSNTPNPSSTPSSEQQSSLGDGLIDISTAAASVTNEKDGLALSLLIGNTTFNASAVGNNGVRSIGGMVTDSFDDDDDDYGGDI